MDALLPFVPYIPESVNSIVKEESSFSGVGNTTSRLSIHKEGGSNAEYRNSKIHQIEGIRAETLLIKVEVTSVSVELSETDKEDYTYNGCYILMWNGSDDELINDDSLTPITTNGAMIFDVPATFTLSPIDPQAVYIAVYVNPTRNQSASSASHQWYYNFNLSFNLTQLYFTL